MPKSKKLDEKSLIHYNLEKLEAKVNEFQDYLQLNKINSSVTKDGHVSLGIDAQDQMHKELIVQIKVQDALFKWLPILEELKEGKKTINEIETYGDVEINGLYKDKLNGG